MGGLRLMLVAFIGIFIYGLLAALPGSVLPTLERNHYLPDDWTVGTFLLINAAGAVLAYLVSGPVIDRIGNKFALACGAALVIASMAGFALTVTRISPGAALFSIFGCALVLGFGANAIVAAGHALVADVAALWRNAALNLLDICFGLGLAALPLVVQQIQGRGGLPSVFWTLGVAAALLLLLVLAQRFPKPAHREASAPGGTKELLRNPSFWLLAVALFMYVGTEVSVGKWVVTFLERDARLLAGHGLDPARLQELSRAAPDALSRFFETDPAGVRVATYALRTLSVFAFALLAGRLVSSLLLSLLRVNSFILLTAGSALTAVALIIAFRAEGPSVVRAGLAAAGFGMGPIFPTSVGLASVMMPRSAGTAMSLAMGVGFAGLLLIPPAVGYISSAAGGAAGDVRTGLTVVIAASVVMLLLHITLTLRERRRASVSEDELESEAVAG
ncbi:MAG: MFS transporter [Alphaproteobacteria bacterium]|nr:MFS transporter [Alphaproteobacteria bacterium]